MSDLRSRILNELEKKGWSPTTLAEKSGVPQPTIQRFLSGKHGEPRSPTIKKIAKGLGLTEAELRGFSQGVISTQLEGPHGCMEGRVDYKPNTIAGPDIRGNVPLISWVKAGNWCEAIDLFNVGDAEDWLPCPVSHGPHTYCLRVCGDSMTNTIPGQKSYPEGTIIFVDPDRPVTNGCRVIAKIPGANEATFKEYREDSGKRYLKPLNQHYQMQEITDGVILCGVVIFSGVPE
jgi:SOS-response transcriptional repressor LexA